MQLTSEAIDRLAAEYVLGTLQGPARARFERLMDADSALQSAVDQWSARLGLLIDAAPRQSVPASVWSRIETTLPTSMPVAEPTSPTPRKSVIWWRRLGFWQTWAGGATAAALFLGFAPGLIDEQRLRDAAVSQSSLPSAQPVSVERPKPARVEVAVVPSTEPLPPASTVATAPVAPALVPAAAPVQVAAQEAAAPRANRAPQAPVAAPRPDSQPQPRSGSPEPPAPRVTRGASRQASTAAAPTASVAHHMGVLAREDGAPGWLVKVSDSGESLLIKTLDDVAAARSNNQVFELWAVSRRGSVRSLGVLPGGDGELELSARNRRLLEREGSALAVSIEPTGGSPDDGPTGPVVFSGPVFEI